MNRFDDYVKDLQVDGWKWLHAKDLGMDAETFHAFVDSLLGGAIDGFCGFDPEMESQSGKRLYHRVKLSRIE